MTREHPDEDVYLHPAQVAALFDVSPKTLNRWVHLGKLASVRTITTLGGHRRFNEGDVHALLASMQHGVVDVPTRGLL